MQRISAFQKVSIEQFLSDFKASFPGSTRRDAEDAYTRVTLPLRATKGSAGYDISLVCPLNLSPGESVRVPTGLRSKIEDGWVLLIFPKSGLGMRYRLQLDNTVGVVDSDYFGAENEGHILIQITNDSKSEKTLALDCGKAFAQGVFLPYGITYDDNAESERVGGFGSTGV